jgi:hypothetical protein
MNTFELNILASDKPFFKGPCESLIVPSLDGKYGILPHHSNMIIAVVPGKLVYVPLGQPKQEVAVSHGRACGRHRRPTCHPGHQGGKGSSYAKKKHKRIPHRPRPTGPSNEQAPIKR